MSWHVSLDIGCLTVTNLIDSKDVNESRNARVSKKIIVLENLISRRAKNSRTHKAKLHD